MIVNTLPDFAELAGEYVRAAVGAVLSIRTALVFGAVKLRLALLAARTTASLPLPTVTVSLVPVMLNVPLVPVSVTVSLLPDSPMRALFTGSVKLVFPIVQITMSLLPASVTLSFTFDR